MGGVVGFGREQAGEVIVGGLCRHPCRAQAQAPADAVDMRIHREGGLAQREEQDNRRCLGADALEAKEPGLCLIRGQPSEEFEVQVPALGRDRLEQGLNPWPFLVGQTGRSDRGDDIFRRGVANGFPGRESAAKGLEGPIPIEVIGVL
jgi:hypothetical protein